MGKCACLPSDITIEIVSADLGEKTITENGRYLASSDDLDGYSAVDVLVGGGNANVHQDAEGYIVLEDEEAGGGSIEGDALYLGTFPSGDVVVNGPTSTGIALYNNTEMTSFTTNSIAQFKTSNTFFGCTALRTFKDTAVITQTQANMFQDCTSLERIELPGMTANAQSYMFANCTALTVCDIGECGQIINNAFRNCTSLTTLIIRRTSVTPLQNVAAFTNTPFASGGSGGTIYVPSSLINSYMSASNWSTLNGYGTVTWAALEGSQYE